MRSILTVPLRAKVIGVLQVVDTEIDRFSTTDLALVEPLAVSAASAIENARLNRTTRKMAAAMTLKQTITTLAHHINNRLTISSFELDDLEAKGQAEYIKRS